MRSLYALLLLPVIALGAVVVKDHGASPNNAQTIDVQGSASVSFSGTTATITVASDGGGTSLVQTCDAGLFFHAIDGGMGYCSSPIGDSNFTILCLADSGFLCWTDGGTGYLAGGMGPQGPAIPLPSCDGGTPIESLSDGGVDCLYNVRAETFTSTLTDAGAALSMTSGSKICLSADAGCAINISNSQLDYLTLSSGSYVLGLNPLNGAVATNLPIRSESTAAGFTSLAASGNAALTIEDGAKICLNSACNLYLQRYLGELYTNGWIRAGSGIESLGDYYNVTTGLKFHHSAGVNDWSRSDGGVVYFNTSLHAAGRVDAVNIAATGGMGAPYFAGTNIYADRIGSNSTLADGGTPPLTVYDDEGLTLKGLTTANFRACDNVDPISGGMRGAIQYDLDAGFYRYCDGTNWSEMRGSPAWNVTCPTGEFVRVLDGGPGGVVGYCASPIGDAGMVFVCTGTGINCYNDGGYGIIDVPGTFGRTMPPEESPLWIATADSYYPGAIAMDDLTDGLIINSASTGVPSIYEGAACSSQFIRELEVSGAATCASVTNSDFSGRLSVDAGGTNSTEVPTAGAVAYGTGTAYAFTAAAPDAGYFLRSMNGAVAPTWRYAITDSDIAGQIATSHGGTSTDKTPTAGGIAFGTGSKYDFTTAAPDAGYFLRSSNGAAAPTWNYTVPASDLSGQVAVANGGTAGTATPTAGAFAYGTGSAYAFSTAAPDAGYSLQSAQGSAAPTWWRAPTQTWTMSDDEHSSTTADATDHAFAVAASQIVSFRCSMLVLNTGTSGTRFAIDAPASTTATNFSIIRHNAVGAGVEESIAVQWASTCTGCTASATLSVPAGASYTWPMSGTVVNGANAGTVTIFAAASTAGQKNYIKKGSFCEWWTN